MTSVRLGDVLIKLPLAAPPPLKPIMCRYFLSVLGFKY